LITFLIASVKILSRIDKQTVLNNTEFTEIMERINNNINSVLDVGLGTNPELKEWFAHIKNFFDPFKGLKIPIQIISEDQKCVK